MHSPRDFIRLVGLAAALFAGPAGALAATTVTGTIIDAAGNALANGTIEFKLSQEGIVTDPALLLQQPVVTCTITTGVIQSCSLRGNDEISPAGTVYKVKIFDADGITFLPERTYSITGATWDIGTQTPNPSSVQTGIHGASLHSGDVIPAANQEFGAFYSDFGEIAVPANPGANVRRLFVSSATGQLSVRTSAGTTVSLEAGGGGGATHQIDGVDLTTQDPINFLDTTEFDWTNPAAGDLSLALKSASVADSKLAQITTASKVSGAAITLLTSVPAGAGALPIANLPDVEALTTSLTADRCVRINAGGTALEVAAADCNTGGAVDSVFTRTGAVVATEGDYSLTLLSDVTGTSGAGSTVALSTFSGLGANDFHQWSGTNWVNASPDAGTDLTADLEEEDHASEHQNAGGDEVATATPGANAIPKAGAGGALAAGWIQEVLALADLTDVTSTTGSGTVVVLSTSPTFTTSLTTPAVISGAADPADGGVLRVGNAEDFVCAELATPGIDLCIQLTASDIWQVDGTWNASTLNEAGNAVPNSTNNLSFFAATTVAQLATLLSDENFTPGSEVSAEGVLDLADLEEKDIDSLTGGANWGSAITKETADLIINGVEVDFEAGAAEGYPRIAQSTTPPATGCDVAAEIGRLYFDTDADTDGSLMVCAAGPAWKEVDDDGAGGGEANTHSSDGGGLALTAATPKVGVDLRLTSMAAADFDLAADLFTIDDTKWAKDSELHTIFSPDADPGVDHSGLSGDVGITEVAGALSFDATEIGTVTWLDNADRVWTFDIAAAGVNPTLAFAASSIEVDANLTVDDEQELRLKEEDAGGENYVGFKAPAAVTANGICALLDSTTDIIPDTCVGGILANELIDLASEVTGILDEANLDTNVVLDPRTITVAGTANEITSSAGAQDLSADRTWTLSLPATIDLGGKTSFEVPNSAGPSVTVFGQIAGDDDFYAASRGVLTTFDGTSAVHLVAVLNTSSPSNGQVPTWVTGGTITWQTPGGSGDVTAVGPGCADGDCFTDGKVTTGTVLLVWEGTGDDANEFTVNVPANPGADIGWTIPDAATALTFPSGTDTLVGRATTDTLSSKTFDSSNVIQAGAYDAASIDGDDIATSLAGTGLTLTAASPDTLDCDAASTTAVGCPEMAIASEVNTGTSTILAVTPDALAGSTFGQVGVQMTLFDFTTAVTTGDGKYYFHIAAGDKLIGMDLIGITAAVITVSSSGLPDVDVARCAPVATGNPCSGTVVDVLTTNVTIDANEDSSFTAATAFSINTANDDVVEDGTWRIDVDGAGTGTQGLIVTLVFQLP